MKHARGGRMHSRFALSVLLGLVVGACGASSTDAERPSTASSIEDAGDSDKSDAGEPDGGEVDKSDAGEPDGGEVKPIYASDLTKLEAMSAGGSSVPSSTDSTCIPNLAHYEVTAATRDFSWKVCVPKTKDVSPPVYVRSEGSRSLTTDEYADLVAELEALEASEGSRQPSGAPELKLVLRSPAGDATYFDPSSYGAAGPFASGVSNVIGKLRTLALQP